MYRVMIVDDVQIFRRQIKNLSIWGAGSGFEIEDEARDGLEALDKLRRSSFDVLITDIRMPVMDGLELLKAVYQEALVPCVVFLSDYGEFSFAKEAIQYGIFDYLLKPVEAGPLQNLLTKIRLHLEAIKAREAEVQTLKSSLNASVAPFYPEGQVQEVIASLTGERFRAHSQFQAVMRSAYETLDGDWIKTKAVLDKVCLEIRSALNRSLTWLPEFLDESEVIPVGLEWDIWRESDEPVVKADTGVAVTNLNDAQGFDLLSQRFKALVEVLDTLDPWGNGHPVVQRIKAYILSHSESISTQDEIAETLYLTRNYLAECFKRETGVTLGDYITKVKLHRAMKLLSDNALKSYEIAERLGYSDEYFSKLFKRHFGMTPTQYRQKDNRNL